MPAGRFFLLQGCVTAWTGSSSFALEPQEKIPESADFTTIVAKFDQNAIGSLLFVTDK